jgi:hypothetical protein
MVTTSDSMSAKCVIRGASAVITATCIPDSRPAAKEAATVGRCCKVLPRATVAEPTAGLAPVATATSIPVEPAPNTRESLCSSAVAAVWVR